MKIDIIGANTKKGIELRNKLLAISANIDEKITINLIKESKCEKVPLLYVNNELVSKGKILSNKDLVKYLKKNL